MYGISTDGVCSDESLNMRVFSKETPLQPCAIRPWASRLLLSVDATVAVRASDGGVNELHGAVCLNAPSPVTSETNSPLFAVGKKRKSYHTGHQKTKNSASYY